MTVKTLSAPSISAALAEARRLFGDDVVLLESQHAQGARAARVTVATEATPTVSPDAASISKVIERVKQPPAPSFGYSAAGTAVDVVAEDDAAEEDEFSEVGPAPRGRVRGRLFPSDGRPLRNPEPVGMKEVTRDIEQLLETRLGSLHERLEGIERRFEGHPASAGKWLRHPLFNRLLDRGLHSETVTDHFFKVTSALDVSDDDALYWALVRSLRDAMCACAPVAPLGTQLFIGPNGCGKTSLILRLATQKNFFGRRRCGVIIIAPASDDARTSSPDATDQYRRAGLPVQNVGTPEEMAPAISRLHGFDHVLVDSPGLPFLPRPMRDALAAIRPFTEHLIPVQTHFVLDATRALEELNSDLLHRMPVAPDAISITHLDGTARPGRICEWLMRAALPVNGVGISNRIHDGLTTFSPAGFAEQLLEA